MRALLHYYRAELLTNVVYNKKKRRHVAKDSRKGSLNKYTFIIFVCWFFFFTKVEMDIGMEKTLVDWLLHSKIM